MTSHSPITDATFTPLAQANTPSPISTRPPTPFIDAHCIAADEAVVFRRSLKYDAKIYRQRWEYQDAGKRRDERQTEFCRSVANDILGDVALITGHDIDDRGSIVTLPNFTIHILRYLASVSGGSPHAPPPLGTWDTHTSHPMVVDEQLATVMADHLNARSSANFCIPLPIIPALSRLALRILCLIDGPYDLDVLPTQAIVWPYWGLFSTRSYTKKYRLIIEASILDEERRGFITSGLSEVLSALATPEGKCRPLAIQMVPSRLDLEHVKVVIDWVNGYEEDKEEMIAMERLIEEERAWEEAVERARLERPHAIVEEFDVAELERQGVDVKEAWARFWGIEPPATDVDSVV